MGLVRHRFIQMHSCEIVTCYSVRSGGTILRCSGINKVSELMKTLTLTSPDLLVSFKSLWSLNQDCLHTFIECIEWIKPSIKNQQSMGKIKLNPPFSASILSNASVSYGRSDYLIGVYSYPYRVYSLPSNYGWAMSNMCWKVLCSTVLINA